MVLFDFFVPLVSNVLEWRVAIIESKNKRSLFSLSRINHAQLRDKNDTEKLLTNIIIEEGKIVQYKIRLSFFFSLSLVLDFYWFFFLRFFLFLSFSLSFV